MKKLALIIDVDNWAFSNIARNIKSRLNKEYIVEIFSIVNYNNNVIDILIACKEYDIIHFFWRGNLLYINSDSYKAELKNRQIDIKDFNENYLENKIITTCVQDHLFIDKDIENTEKIFGHCPSYYVSSQKLFDIYNQIDHINKPMQVIHDGVDLNKFYIYDKDKYNIEKINNRKIVIGWVGNSMWHSNEEDFKGFNTIIKPALQELIKEGTEIEFKYIDKQEKIIPHDEMPKYYNSIDVLVCASKQEGTPMPIVEAMACGNVIISTDVGIVPEIFGSFQKKFILSNRDKNSLKEKIKMLLKEKESFNKISIQNQENAKRWSWDKISVEYANFFKNAQLNKLEEIKMKEKQELDNYKKENDKQKMLLEELKYENEYMKVNIKKINKELKKIKKSKIYKIISKIKRIKKKIRRK